jgi:3-oxoadipate enol-lactonase
MPFHERQIEVDGFEIRYWKSGQGRPVVMLDPTGWRETVLHDALAEQYQVFSLELPGTGDSPANTVSESIGDLGSTVAKAAASITSEKYTLVGTSFGASVALWQTLRSPEQVEALILVSPMSIKPQHVPVATNAVAAHRVLFAHEENSTNNSPLSQATYDKESELSQRLRVGVHDVEAEGRLGDIHCPTLAIFGQEDHFVTPEAPRVYREKIPNCNIALVYDAGHCIIGDRPEALVNAIIDYAEHWETFIIGRHTGLINP